MGPALRLWVCAGLMSVTLGLRVIDSPNFNCSQPGIQCSVRSSSCLDLSWIRPFEWTPTAPSNMQVTSGIGVDEQGRRVPVLQINWTVSEDSSIRDLQGVEISVLEISLQLERCVLFQFNNIFQSQRDQNNQPWKFFYNNFEVIPGNEYHISVQHLPKWKDGNRKTIQHFRVPDCRENDMKLTYTCCNEGNCWTPNITVDFAEGELIVAFNPLSDAHKYGVKVNIVPEKKELGYKMIEQGVTSERMRVTFTTSVPYNPCWYNVSVWPYMEPCGNDCLRRWYVPKCPPPPPPPPPVIPVRPYVWLIAAVVTFSAFTVTIILLWCMRVCVSPSECKVPSLPPPVPPPLVKQRVWIVYSADHELYVNVVLKLADFLRVGWGLDVVLDRHNSQEIGLKGAMTWLSHQKDQIEKLNGTILILCSRGAQAKWKAMQQRQPGDTSYQSEDLFTPALTLILPDFQKAKPYDRYVVAYFSELSDVGDILSPLEICPRYALIQNLETLLFRFQRIEQNQPKAQYHVDVEGNPNYGHLVKAIEQCRDWQETHLDWFGKECPIMQANEENVSLEGEVGHGCTRRAYLHIRPPEASVSVVTPHIVEPAPVSVVNPSLVVGPSSVGVIPLLNEALPPVATLQPSLNTEASRESYRQQPFLVIDEQQPVYNDPLHQMDLSVPGEHSVQSEDLGEAQKRFFHQSFDPHMNPDIAFHELSLGSLGLSISSDQEVQSMNLMEAQKMFLFQSFLDGPATDLGESFSGSEDYLDGKEESKHDCVRHMDISIPHDQGLQINDTKEALTKFFLQTFSDDQLLAPDMVINAKTPLHEHQPLLVDANKPPLPEHEPLLQVDSSRCAGQGFQSMDLRGTRKNWLNTVGQRVTPNMDVLEDGLDMYEEINVVMGRTDNKDCDSEDLGYGTLNHLEMGNE